MNMLRKIKTVVSLICIVFLSVIITSCGKDAKITGMEIVSDGADTSYYVGDTFDPSGFEIRVTYDDGNVKTYALTADMLGGGKIVFDKVESKSIIITYSEGGLSLSGKITVSVRDRYADEREAALSEIENYTLRYTSAPYDGTSTATDARIILSVYTKKIANAKDSEDISALVSECKAQLDDCGDRNGIDAYKVELMKLIRAHKFGTTDLDGIRYKLSDENYERILGYIENAEYDIVLAQTKTAAKKRYDEIGIYIKSINTVIDDIYDAHKAVGTVTPTAECRALLDAVKDKTEIAKALLAAGGYSIDDELSSYDTGNDTVNLGALIAADENRYEQLSGTIHIAEEIVAKISDIGSIALGSEAKIKDAETALKKWMDDYSISVDDKNMQLIENYDVLTAARRDFDALKAAAEKDAAEIISLIDNLGDAVYSRDGAFGTKTAAIDEKIARFSETYGDIYISEYIGNEKTDRLSECKTEYGNRMSEANEINSKTELLLSGVINKDSYNDVEEIQALIESFSDKNSGVLDVIDRYSDFTAARLTCHKDVYEDYVTKKRSEFFNKYQSVSNMNEAVSDKFVQCRESIRAEYDENKSLEENKKAADDRYETACTEFDAFVSAQQ